MLTDTLNDSWLHKLQVALWTLIGITTPLFVNFWVVQQFEASKVWLLRSLVWMLTLLWFMGWLYGRPHRPLPRLVRDLAVLLVLVMVLSTAMSDANLLFLLFGSLERASGLLTQVSYLLLFGCVATQITTEEKRPLLLIIILTSIPICLLGVGQAAGWQPLPVLTDGRSDMVTTLGRSNFTGAYLALLLPLTVTAAVVSTGRFGRLGWGALCGLEIVVIVLTQARAAWLAAAAAAAILLWLHHAPHKSNRWRWSSLLAGMTALVGFLAVVMQQGVANGGSIAARWTIWQASGRLLWPQLWLGYGADALELHFHRVYPPELVYYQGRGVIVDRAHNWLLDWSLSYGGVATVIFSLLVGAVLWKGWQFVRLMASGSTAEQAVDARWVMGCMAAVCGHLVGNLFLFEVASTAVVFWLMLALIVSAGLEVQQSRLSLSGVGRYGLIVVAALVVGWGVWAANVRPFVADRLYWQGVTAQNRAVALEQYQAAVAHQPHRTAYLSAVAFSAAQLGLFDTAEQALAQAMALRPTDPVLYTQLAEIYAYGAAQTNGRYQIEQAYEAYGRAIELAPTVGVMYQQYAAVALQSGRRVIAIEQAEKAVALDATDGVAFGILGWAYLEEQSLIESQQAFEQALRWEPDSADFHLGLATVYFIQGDHNAARQAVHQSLTLDPTYAPSLLLQSQMQTSNQLDQ